MSHHDDTLGAVGGLLMVGIGKFFGTITIASASEAVLYGLLGGLGGWIAHKVLNLIFKRKRQ